MEHNLNDKEYWVIIPLIRKSSARHVKDKIPFAAYIIEKPANSWKNDFNFQVKDEQ